MKLNVLITALIIGATSVTTLYTPDVTATSIGRGGGSVSVRSSPSVSTRGATNVGGIGGTSGSMGVRKSAVTDPIAQRSAPTPTYQNSSSSYQSPTPTYSAPAAQSSGSTFWSSLGGSLVGTTLGNSISGNHGGGTTVINNGGAPAYQSGSAYQPGPGGQYEGNGLQSGPGQSHYGFGDFLKDLIVVTLIIITLAGIAWLLYEGFKKGRSYINKERGVSNQPFNPTQRFWEIQRAFSAAEVYVLKSLLGPDLVDEATANLEPSSNTIHNVSHEVVLNNQSEFSVHYRFTDDGKQIQQVWHYEKHNGAWVLNGIENI